MKLSLNRVLCVAVYWKGFVRVFAIFSRHIVLFSYGIAAEVYVDDLRLLDISGCSPWSVYITPDGQLIICDFHIWLFWYLLIVLVYFTIIQIMRTNGLWGIWKEWRPTVENSRIYWLGYAFPLAADVFPWMVLWMVKRTFY